MFDIATLSVLAHAASEVAHGAEHAEPTAFGLGAGAWVALSVLALFGIMIYAKVPALVGSMLDKKIDGIRHLLDEAAVLRKEAEALKAEYEGKLANASRDAAMMTAAAEQEAARIVSQANTDAAALVARREKMAEDKIAAAERAAIDELRARTATAAAEAARAIIAARHDAAQDKVLVDSAISSLG